jgi:hypothetical protein
MHTENCCSVYIYFFSEKLNKRNTIGMARRLAIFRRKKTVQGVKQKCDELYACF